MDKEFNKLREDAYCRYRDLLNAIFGSLNWDDIETINPNDIRTRIHDMYKNELNLIMRIEKYELEKQTKEARGLLVPSFMIKPAKGREKRAI